jgi:hypothetical protein
LTIYFLIFIAFKWGLGIGDWGLGIGDWGLGPIPKTQNPKPKTQNKFINKIKNLKKIKFK